MKVRVLKHWAESSAARAALANRFRKSLDLKVGDHVVYGDPKAQSGGRVPYRRSLTGPWVVLEVKGNKAHLETFRPAAAKAPAQRVAASAGAEQRDDPPPKRLWGHIEDMILCPPDAEDFESPSPHVDFDESKAGLEFDEPDGVPRSIGEIVQGTQDPKP